jgi:hypothetical protein
MEFISSGNTTLGYDICCVNILSFFFFFNYSYMIECDVSDREDELRVQALSMSNGSSKRSKISKKVDSFDEWKFLVIVHAP